MDSASVFGVDGWSGPGEKGGVLMSAPRLHEAEGGRQETEEEAKNSIFQNRISS
jgi:hypothetical protein